MQGVVVIFTADGKITVVPEDLAAKAGQLIAWRVVNNNGAVQQVEIKFTPPKAYFGANPLGGPYAIIKKLNNKAQLLVYGEAPPVGGGKVEAHKYAVSGLDAMGGPLLPAVTVDPRIVVTEP